jgi:hypothetical protein
MKNRLLNIVAIGSIAAGTSFTIHAINPTYDTFGSTSDTFGGSGIPNDAVAQTVITDGGATITLGLTAHQRYDNPALSNDGAGTFTATAGSNAKPTAAGAVGALWNFAWDIDIDGGAGFDDYDFDLRYDFDPAASTAEGAHGIIHLNTFTWSDNSQNLLFSFLDGNTLDGFFSVLVGLTTPPSGSFDPGVNGEYTFALIASNTSGELGRSAIRVNVVGGRSVPDGGATLLLLAFGAGGLAAFRQVRR